MDELLAELQFAGLLDSHGEFSIDFAQAMQRLGKQNLVDSRMYVLRLYQSAVCAGAVRVDFAGNSASLHCRSWGPPVPLEQLCQLSGYLFPNSQHLAASYLASALHAALSTSPRSLQLITWDGREGASLTFSKGQESFRVLDSSPFANRDPQTCLVVERRPNWFFRKVPEWEWLRTHGGAGPALLSINRAPVTFEFGGPRDLLTHKLYLPGSYVTALGGEIATSCPKNYHVFQRILPSQGGFNRILLPNHGLVEGAVAIRADLAGMATLKIVHHGLLLPDVSLQSPLPGLDLLSTSTGLTMDVSGLRAVGDEAYKALHARLFTIAQKLWDEKRKFGDYRTCIARALTNSPKAKYQSY